MAESLLTWAKRYSSVYSGWTAPWYTCTTRSSVASHGEGDLGTHRIRVWPSPRAYQRAEWEERCPNWRNRRAPGPCTSCDTAQSPAFLEANEFPLTESVRGQAPVTRLLTSLTPPLPKHTHTDIYDLYSWPRKIRIIKSRGMRCGQSSWLRTQRSRVLFPELPDFLSSSGSGTRSTQPLWG
jgi:hypothetical protein